MDNGQTLLERQYRLAIDARDKLNDNYHKWMTFYYVANGAILVAITSLLKDNVPEGIFILSLIGVFICLLWYMSCKGYYYWSKSWIYIIIALEKRVTEEHKSLGVYSVFSQKVVDDEQYAWLPLKPANISTPKLTLLFSVFSIIAWTAFSIYELMISYPCLCYCCRACIISAIILITLVLFFVLPFFVKSRIGTSHTLI